MADSQFLRRLRVVAATALLVGTVSAATAPAAGATTEWIATLSGANVVPGPGDDDAAGRASLLFEANVEEPGSGVVCAFWEITDLDPATTAELATGAPGEVGTHVLDLPAPDEEGFGGDCVTDLDPVLVQAVIDDPTAYYVNVRNGAYPDGAVRGQIDADTFIGITVVKVVCPGRIRTPADLAAAPAGTCTIAARTGDIGDPPAGHLWRPAPTEFDMQVTLQHGDDTLTLDDTEFEGGSSCGPRYCTPFRSYLWPRVSLGLTTITELTFPKGYRFGWATVQSTFEGGTAPTATIDVANASITFDTSGFASSEGLFVVLYDFRGGAR